MEGENVSNKRKSEDQETALTVKKQKIESNQLTIRSDGSKQIQEFKRTSNLMAPIMLLTGHKAEVLSTKFSHEGKHIISGSFDKNIFLWEVYGECKNLLAMKGHSNAVLEVCWSPTDEFFFSASADKTLATWDTETGRRLKKYTQHSSIVNSIASSYGKTSQIIVSGSDDSFIKIWDIREKKCVNEFRQGAPVLSVSFSKDNSQVFAGSVDNTVTVWDLRMDKMAYKLQGHEDSVTGVKLSPDGSSLLTNSMDNTVRVWDVKPFCATDRCLKTFQGIQHNFEKNLLRCSWSNDGNRISAGSADRFVYIWDANSRRIIYKLPGHKGTVNETDFHPKEPIIASCSNDGTIYLGEIKP